MKRNEQGKIFGGDILPENFKNKKQILHKKIGNKDIEVIATQKELYF